MLICVDIVFSFTSHEFLSSEFCMEIDAATEFAKGWDTMALHQWAMTGNEYAVLSTVPLSTKDRARVQAGTEIEVPRQCAIKVGSEGVPVSKCYEFAVDCGLCIKSSISSVLNTKCINKALREPRRWKGRRHQTASLILRPLFTVFICQMPLRDKRPARSICSPAS